MNKHSNPIEFLIDFAWASGADRFVVNNAKDELKKLRENNFHVAFWARINNRGDLYNPSVVYNPHLNQDTILPIYVNEKEYKQKYGNLSK